MMHLSVCWQPALMTSDLGRIVHYAGLWGVDGVELRTLGRHGERVPDVNVAAVRRRVHDGELDVIAVDPGFFTARADERSVWMNDLQQLPDVVRFCTQISARAILLEGLETSGTLPTAPYEEALRLARLAPGVEFLVLDTGVEGQVADLVARTGSKRLKRAAVTSLTEPALQGDMSQVGMIRCSASFTKPPDESDLSDVWTGFLREKIAEGFAGHVVFEFTATAEPGKTGLRVATALVKAAARASRSS